MAHKYTHEQIEWLRNNRDNGSYESLATLFNDLFDTNVNDGSISNACSRYKIKCAEGHVNRGFFKKGNKSWNKGLKGVNGLNHPNWFKKGMIPVNQLPVGTERLKKDGYIEIKQNNGWKAKNRVVWEEKNGHIPNGYVIIFLDSDTTNCDIENLSLVSRAELAQLNKKDNFKSQMPEIKKALINVVRFELETNKLKMKNKNNE